MSARASPEQIRAYLAKRDACLRNATMADAVWLWREAKMAPPDDPIMPLVALHKARVQWRDASEGEVSASRRWLLERGYPVPVRPADFSTRTP